MATALGYIDELIRHIDSRKPVFVIMGASPSGRFKYTRAPKQTASFLACNPKFTLPTLGQFYRPLSDLEEMANTKFNMYVEGYELDMLQYPPFDEFTIEFDGRSPDVQIVTKTATDIEYVKFVILCKKVSQGIVIEPYYFNAAPLEGIPEGWVTNGLPFLLKYESKENRIKSKNGIGFSVPFAPVGQIDWEGRELSAYVSGMWPEIRAVYQFLVALNVKSGVVRDVAHTPKRSGSLGGRRTGFEYHILDIDPEYVVRDRGESTGTHASPRFHLRRAHLRHFANDTVTLVRQAKVGNPMKGIVEKDYRIKKD